jgi:hypothetical protein
VTAVLSAPIERSEVRHAQGRLRPPSRLIISLNPVCGSGHNRPNIRGAPGEGIVEYFTIRHSPGAGAFDCGSQEKRLQRVKHTNMTVKKGSKACDRRLTGRALRRTVSQ